MIRRWIDDALAATGIRPRPLSDDEVRAILGAIAERYVEPSPPTRSLWEAFRGGVSRRRADGWSLICDYPEPSPILLIMDDDKPWACEFSSPSDLRRVLAESTGFEFSVTNRDAGFVLCHNHHDYLIGVGACRRWLTAIEGE